MLQVHFNSAEEFLEELKRHAESKDFLPPKPVRLTVSRRQAPTMPIQSLWVVGCAYLPIDSLGRGHLENNGSADVYGIVKLERYCGEKFHDEGDCDAEKAARSVLDIISREAVQLGYVVASGILGEAKER